MSEAPTHTRFEAHRRAKAIDAREVLSRGETYTTIILDENTRREGFPMAKIEKIRTFIRPGPGLSTDQLHEGRTVRVKITDVGDSHVNAMAIALLE